MRVAVLELVGFLELVVGVSFLFESLEIFVRDLLSHAIEEGVSGFLGASFVVVASVVVTTVLSPVSLNDVSDANKFTFFGGLVGLGEDRKPSQNSPDTILFADVIGSGSEGFLTADGKLSSVHEISKVLPSSRHLMKLDVLGLSDEVNGTAGGHGPGAALEPLAEVWDALLSLVNNDSQRVGRSDEELLAEDHVAVSVTVSGGAELGNLSIINRILAKTHDLHEILRVSEVRVGVSSTEILLGLGVQADSFLIHSKLLSENLLREGSSYTMHGIVDHGEVLTGRELLDSSEVEDALHLLSVHAYGIHHLNVHVSKLVESLLVEINRRDLLGDDVFLDLL
mmetsp:Transcript_15743/g.29905  ORF Transcript_15743/g.29905 Transcript_15743/m.29905 type:complete len:339 (-) Transcript_15743:535-1551(-)